MNQNLSQFAIKAFNNPQKYRNMLLNLNLVSGNHADLSGKTFICVSLTRFCPVGCKFCFFKSGPVFKQPTREDLLTTEGLNAFIHFSNQVNLGYLLVSGGGEPMMEKQSVLKIIEQVKSERIVLVTSAHWAKTVESAERYLESIQESLSKRTEDTRLTVRVSVDSEHAISLGIDPILNLIRLFAQKYQFVKNLDLQIHSLDGDATIDHVLDILKSEYTIARNVVNESRISDGENAVKIVPKQEILSFDTMMIKVGYAKAFYSNLRVNVSERENIQKNIDVYQKDLFESEDGNSAIVTNKLGNPGLDFWVNYNGNVTTWGNQYLDNLFNIYVDSPQDVIQKTLQDPAALSFIEKGANYRDRVVAEANEIAVIRSKAVNIRDYTGALMFDEARTRLYYTIRTLQDYLSEGRINQDVLNTAPSDLKNLLMCSKEDLIGAYQNTQQTIVQQTIDKGFDKDYVLDILEWIKLGHYQITKDEQERLIHFYNDHVAQENRIDSLENLPHNLKMQIVRMTEHLTHIKKQALQDIALAA